MPRITQIGGDPVSRLNPSAVLCTTPQRVGARFPVSAGAAGGFLCLLLSGCCHQSAPESLSDLVERQRSEIRSMSARLTDGEKQSLRAHLEFYSDEVQ